jgi:hypothetical protein
LGVFARRLRVEVEVDGRREPCRLEWLDGFCMRRFTGEAAFDDTLPVADGELEAGSRVDTNRLARELAAWLTRKKGAGKTLSVHISERAGAGSGS